MHQMMRTGSVMAIAIAAAAGISPQASAQQTALEEVIVTAQKREESSQSVPLSITAISEEMLVKQGIQSTGDLLGKVPGIGGTESPGAKGSVNLSLRGIAGGAAANLSLDPAVGIYLNGVFVGKQTGSALDVAEIERIEVLRGPQGTLYGRNSTGGAINFVTRQPTGEFGLRAVGNLGDYGYQALKLNVDLPSIGEVGKGLGALSASVGGQTRQRDGFYTNESAGQPDFDDLDRQAMRIALKWEISDDFSVDYAYDHSELDETNTLQQLVGFNPVDAAGEISRVAALQGVLAGARFWATVPGTDPRIADRWIPSLEQTLDIYQDVEARGAGRADRGNSDSTPSTRNEVKGHALTLNWDVGDLTFKSITGYRETTAFNFGDIEDVDSRVDDNGIGAYNDLLHLTLGQLYGATGGFDPGIPQLPFDALWNAVDSIGAFHTRLDTTSEYEMLSQELQVLGGTEQLEYVLGLYYFEDEGKYRRNAIFAAPVAGNPSQNYDNATDAVAIFGQTTWRPTWQDERFAFTLGLRYTEEDKETIWDYPEYFSPFAGVVPGSTASNAESYSNVSGNATIAYQATEDVKTYLRFATGYRSGGFNGEQFNTPAFSEETVETWEIGLKSDWWDRRLRINASLYNYVYDDIQTSVIETINGAATTRVINAGKAERWGSELEVLVAPIEDLTLSLSYTYINGDYDEYPDVCGVTACLSGVEYAERSQSPDNQINFTANYVFARTTLGELTGFIGINWQDVWYENSIWTEVYASGEPVVHPFLGMDERTLINARLSLEEVEMGGGKLRVSLWGENLTDDDYSITGINFGGLAIITEGYGAPRTWGVEFAYEY
ncbi:MAG: TonB-dependent receptor [Haliea sp.]|nr:TonB-dependent receptor [Haliea sp.]|tara:strand:- start:3623 stop:6130 length:2508 start_codon:yes stop_codon:yes gene_type:complete